MTDHKVVAKVEKVQITVSAKGDITKPHEIEVYGHAVKFMAFWMQKQDGVMDMTTEDLFEEFKANVCKAMMGETKGTG